MHLQLEAHVQLVAHDPVDDVAGIDLAEVARRAASIWGEGARCIPAAENFQKETLALRLDSSRAKAQLDWQPRWPLDKALRNTVEWYRAWTRNEDLHAVTLAQIDDYLATTP